MKTITATRYQLGRIPFIFVLLIIATYFWLFGDAHFPDWSYNGLSYATTISYYIVLLVIFLIFSRLRLTHLLNVPFEIGVKQFAKGFVATLIFMILAVYSGFVGQNPLATVLILPMIIMQVAIVAPAEELMFRGVVLSYIGIVGQAILFAAWHTVTYGAIWSKYGWPSMESMYALFIAFAFGIVMGLVAKNKKLGLPACIGAHACLNIVVLGVFAI